MKSLYYINFQVFVKGPYFHALIPSWENGLQLKNEVCQALLCIQVCNIAVFQSQVTKTYIFVGISCGSILSFIITGFICSSWYGWPYSFYFFGLCGGIWCAFYLKFGYNSPAAHPSIKPEERQYIEKSLGQASGRAVRFFYYYGA